MSRGCKLGITRSFESPFKGEKESQVGVTLEPRDLDPSKPMGVQDVILSMGKLIIPTAIRVLKHVLLLVGLILLWGLSTYVGLAPDIEEVLSIPVWTLMWMVGKFCGVLVVIVIILGGIYVYVSYNKVRNDLKGKLLRFISH